MKRNQVGFWRIILYPTRLHILGVLIALTCCFPIIFPEICPSGTAELIIRYAGIILLSMVAISFILVIVSAATHMLRLSNTRAFAQIAKWGLCWAIGSALFIILAIAADVSPPQTDADNRPIQGSDTLHVPREQLNGPASLEIPIETKTQQTARVADTPNLLQLEQKHEELLKEYLSNSPRWSSLEGDDTFYSKPGHLVMVPPTSSGAPGLVHVSFRRLVEGDPLPHGYSVVQPGSPFPSENEADKHIPDIALDLGKNHYLLLAWRGSEHRETAIKAINAAIEATDMRMQPLLESPTPETARQLLGGRESYPGNTPELRLCEPLAQEGAYQAELYANPGEPGIILVYIKELSTDKTLRLLNLPARYSADKQELFRHDIPGSLPEWIRSTDSRDISNIFPRKTPLFAIRLGTQHQYFGVAFEVWFKPSDVRMQRRLLLRRCYKVQAYDPPATESAPTDAPQT